MMVVATMLRLCRLWGGIKLSAGARCLGGPDSRRTATVVVMALIGLATTLGANRDRRLAFVPLRTKTPGNCRT